MRVFLFVLAFILILFGVSVLYYRSSPGGAFSLPKISFFGNPFENKNSENISNGNVLSSETEKYKSIDIVEGTSGRLDVGQKRVYFAVAKLDSGGSVSVNGNWYLSDNGIGVLDNSQGTETSFTATKDGKTIIFLSFSNLKAEKQIAIGGAVLGLTVSPTATPKKKTTVSTAPAVTTSPTTLTVTAKSVNIYDPDGRRISVGDGRTYNAKVVFSDGSEKVVAVSWSLSGDLGTLSQSSGTTTDFKALKSGSGTLNASYQGISSTLSIQVF